MQFLEPELLRIAEDVFRVVLGFEVTRAPSPGGTAGRPTYLGSVQISGAWNGVIQLHGPEVLVARAASVMFGVPAPETSLEQRLDAFGELANILGGNAKALLPEPCHMSLPTVVVGTDYSVRVPSRTRVRTELTLASADDPFVVRVLEGAGEA